MYEIQRSTINYALTILAVASLIWNSFFGGIAALAFIVSGFLIVIINYETIAAWGAGFLIDVPFLLCFLSVLSVFWSDFPSHAARMSLQIVLTTLIAYSFSKVVNIHTLCRSVVLVSMLAAVCNIAVNRYVINGLTYEDNLVGIFASKNFLAVHTSLGMLSALYLFKFARNYMDRYLSFFCILLSVIVILKAKSLGVVVAVVITIALSILLKKTSDGISLKPAVQRLSNKLFNLGVMVIFVIVLSFYSALSAGVFDNFLYEIGKDPTLTGRTFLWELAYSLIQNQPFLGVGFQSFFIPDNVIAGDVWDYFRIEEGAGFNFHNLYIDTAVELGLVGALLLLVFIYHLLKKSYFYSEESGVFIRCIIYFLFLQTFLEANWMNQFTLMHFLTVYVFYQSNKVNEGRV